MSCLDPKNIPQSLLPPAKSLKRANDAIGTLSAYSFFTKQADQSFDLHPLVHLATRERLRREMSLERWASKAISRLNEVFPHHDHKNRSVWRAYLPHARYVLNSDLIKNSVKEKAELVWKFGMCLYSVGRYKEAEGSFARVRESRKRVLGKELPDTLTSMANLASTFWNQGRWKEAEELEAQVMETRKRVL